MLVSILKEEKNERLFLKKVVHFSLLSIYLPTSFIFFNCVFNSPFVDKNIIIFIFKTISIIFNCLLNL